jgi:hypothetical protein
MREENEHSVIFCFGRWLNAHCDCPLPKIRRRAGGMATKTYKVNPFIEKVDADKDGAMTKDEWKAAGLIEMPFNQPGTIAKRFGWPQFSKGPIRVNYPLRTHEEISRHAY